MTLYYKGEQLATTNQIQQSSRPIINMKPNSKKPSKWRKKWRQWWQEAKLSWFRSA